MLKKIRNIISKNRRSKVTDYEALKQCLKFTTDGSFRFSLIFHLFIGGGGGGGVGNAVKMLKNTLL